jgi:hypothetical protein
MNLLDRVEFEALIRTVQGPCVSVFMPTDRTGLGFQQDPIRLRNLLRTAEERLAASGVKAVDARNLLAPAQKLLSDDSYWRHLRDGLAVFAAPSAFRHYRLPVTFDEIVVAADRFHVRPLLPLFTGDGRFYVLTLSQNDVRLLQGTRHSIDEVPLNGVPRTIDQALQADGVDKPRRFLSAQPARRGDRAGIYHGHGEEAPTKENLLRFFHLVDKGLRQVLREERAPLLVAAVEYLIPIYREANSYGHLLETGIEGSPEAVKPEDLRRAAWQIVEPYFRAKETEAAARFKELAGTGRASRKIREALPAAHQGRVEVLFVAKGVQHWGQFDPGTNGVHLHDAKQPGDEELLDRAAIETILHRGTVFAVDRTNVPGDGPLAALYRY